MKILRFLLYIFLVVAGMYALFLIYSTLSDYRPGEKVRISEVPDAPVLKDSAFTIMTWNIGYCGLGDDMDFFYDGGRQVRSSRESVEDNLAKVLDFTGSQDSVDFLLFQEVDLDSRRSYHIDQLSAIRERLPGFYSSLGKNYDVSFVPVPLRAPYGKVLSGIATLSRYQPFSSVRHAFPGTFPWPLGVFILDRCFLVDRFPLPGGEQLLVINTHNSAYDDGSLRKEQMEFLHSFLEEESGKGNYIIAGGDWNQTPHDFHPEFSGNIFDTLQLTYIEKDYLPEGWTWLYDARVPTNRRIDIPYDPAVSRTTVIDFYLLSPNLEAVEIKTSDMDFSNSDH